MVSDGATLMVPSVEYAASYLDALREGHADTTDAHRQVALAVIEADVAAHIAGLNAQDTIIRLPDGSTVPTVPFAHLWLVDGGAVIGWVSVRYRLTERLLRSGGHIGYGIRPGARRRGYGRMALVLALRHAREKGLASVLVTCSDSNAGSVRIIESCGGVLENTEPHPDFPAVLTRRYWIGVG